MSFPNQDQDAYQLRQRIFFLIFALSVVFLTRPTWQAFLPASPEEQESWAQEGDFAETIVFLFEAKYIIGAIGFFEGLDLPVADQIDSLRQTVLRDEEPSAPVGSMLLRLILYDHLELQEAAAGLRARLRESPAPRENLRADSDSAVVRRLLRYLYLEEEPLSDEDAATLRTQLAFLGDLALLRSYNLDSDPRAEELASSISREAKRFAALIIVGTFFFLALLVVGFGLLVAFLAGARSGKLKMGFQPGTIPTSLMWETFTLFLLFLALSQVFASFIQGPPLMTSVLMELLLLLVLAYPILQGAGFSELKRDLGIFKGKGFLKEVAIGPLGYAACLPLVAIGAVVTLVVSQALGAEVTEGMHPIVPLLAGRDSPWVAVLAVLLAVVMAPVIEEVMFRGFFHRALRARFSAPITILISGALFAAIHPQGLIGFSLLLPIGLMLATLREWRGSLLAPLVAHACTNALSMTILLSL